MRELAQKARTETENLEKLLREREIELEGCKKEIETVKMEKDHLNHKVAEVFPFETLKIKFITLFFIVSGLLLVFNLIFICFLFSCLKRVKMSMQRIMIE